MDEDNWTWNDGMMQGSVAVLDGGTVDAFGALNSLG
jgi:hypothetical protein